MVWVDIPRRCRDYPVEAQLTRSLTFSQGPGPIPAGTPAGESGWDKSFFKIPPNLSIKKESNWLVLNLWPRFSLGPGIEQAPGEIYPKPGVLNYLEGRDAG